MSKFVMPVPRAILGLFVLLLFGAVTPATAVENENAAIDIPVIGEEEAIITTAPNVPPPITRDHATKVIVNLEVRERTGTLSDGVEYSYWAFGDSVPGPFIRVREGDLVEVRLHNHPSSKLPHNIDLHAATGPGGGAAATLTPPGRTSSFTFKAINPGLFVYHCATQPVVLHVANGMYGVILVEPAEGMDPVDREYYVMQSEFYTKGRHGEAGLQPFNQEKALNEQADYVVFNGAVGSLTGDNALRAMTGERVRLFIGNGGPNYVSSFHVIGEVFDKVYIEGSPDMVNRNVQSTLVPAGGSTIVEMDIQVPGDYILVDHSLVRAFNKGALGILHVEEDLKKLSAERSATVFTGDVGKTATEVYEPDDATSIPSTGDPAVASASE